MQHDTTITLSLEQHARFENLKQKLAEATRLSQEAWDAYRQCNGTPMQCHELWAKVSGAGMNESLAASALGHFMMGVTSE